MNKTDILKIMHKRTTQLTVLSLIFVGMMVFLAAGLAEQAQARIVATAFNYDEIRFSDVSGHMTRGVFVSGPSLSDGKTEVHWTTSGATEEGFVEAKFGKFGLVKFEFKNPQIGRNTCDVLHGSSLRAGCTITQGNFAEAYFAVGPKRLDNNNNNYCDILSESSSLEQTKAIIEKLHC